MRVLIRAAGILGPGLPDWHSSVPVLAGQAAYRPAPVHLSPVEALPPAERRRTGAPIRLALSTGMQALANSGLNAADVVTVFGSSGGDGQVIHEICEALATEQREVSPTRFHNSVHNAPAGYWGIATRAHAASTSLCAYDWSFAACLLEGCAQVVTAVRPVLIVSYDVPYPEPLHRARALQDTLGVALVLSPAQSNDPGTILELQVSPLPRSATTMHDPGLENLRNGNPSGRALPLLEALAGGAQREIALEYIGGTLLLHTRKA